MFISLLEMLDNSLLCYAEGGSEGASASKTPEDDKGKPNDGKQTEETVTMTKAELEAKLTQKYAEGARKAQEGKLNNPSLEQKPSTEPNKIVNGQADAPDLSKEINAIKSELTTYKAMNFATDNNIKPEYKEDLVAIIKGKGLEPTAENVKKEADKHPEWKYTADGKGEVKPLGSSGGQSTPPEGDERDQASKLFR